MGTKSFQRTLKNKENIQTMIWNIVVSKPWLKWQQTFRQIMIQCSLDHSLKVFLAQNSKCLSCRSYSSHRTQIFLGWSGLSALCHSSLLPHIILRMTEAERSHWMRVFQVRFSSSQSRGLRIPVTEVGITLLISPHLFFHQFCYQRLIIWFM